MRFLSGLFGAFFGVFVSTYLVEYWASPQTPGGLLLAVGVILFCGVLFGIGGAGPREGYDG